MSQYYLGNLGNLVTFQQVFDKEKNQFWLLKSLNYLKINDSLFKANNEIIQILKITSDFSKDYNLLFGHF